MNQAGHIFSKDARHFRWEIGISLALLVALAWVYPFTFMPAEWINSRAGNPDVLRGVAGLLAALVPVSWWVMITRLVQDENLVGDQQWWITKPYEWPQLMGSKLVFLGAFLVAPLFVAQCALLAVAGFRPFTYLPNLGFDLLLMAGLVVIPLMAIAAVTSSFGKMTLTLLGMVVAFIAYVVLLALIVQSQGNVWVPAAGGILLVVLAAACCAAIVLQYARRQVWVARLVLIAAGVILIGGVAAASNSLVLAMSYPRASAPLQLTYDTAERYNATSQPAGMKWIGLPVPVVVSGIAKDVAVNLDAVQVSGEGPDGRRWPGEWVPIIGARYDANSDHEMLPLQVSRAFYDAEKANQVTLQLRFAVSTLEAGRTTAMALPDHEFSVPDFGICTPEMYEHRGQFHGVSCRAALHQPQATLVQVQWSDDPCSVSQAATVQGKGWAGEMEPAPAEFGLSPVVQVGFTLSNDSKTNISGESAGPRYLCAGSPVSFTAYSLVRRSEYDVTLTGVRMPAMSSR